MEFLRYILEIIIVVTSGIVLYIAASKNTKAARLSVFVLFGALVLSQFLAILIDWSLFDFMKSIVSSLQPFVIYGEVILLVIILITNFDKMNRILKPTLIILAVIKVLLVLGIV